MTKRPKRIRVEAMPRKIDDEHYKEAFFKVIDVLVPLDRRGRQRVCDAAAIFFDVHADPGDIKCIDDDS